jgi:lipopolysaccharide export system permease protein
MGARGRAELALLSNFDATAVRQRENGDFPPSLASFGRFHGMDWATETSVGHEIARSGRAIGFALTSASGLRIDRLRFAPAQRRIAALFRRSHAGYILPPMRRIDRYILRQLAGPFLFFAATLTGVIWITQSLRFVDLIINKGLSAGLFFYLTLLILPGVWALILPIALFAAVLYTYYRLSADRELVVMGAAGLGPRALARPALALAGVVTVLVYVLTLWLMPLGQRSFANLKAELRTNLSYVLLQEGAFNTVGSGLTVYIRSRGAEGELLGILVHDGREPDRPATMMAERGALVRTEDGPRLVLIAGNRQQIDRSGGQLSMLYFDRYTLDLAPFVSAGEGHWLEPGERYLGELFYPEGTPDDLANAGRLHAEGHDRLASPLYGVAFALIALSALFSGEFKRRGLGWRVAAAVGVAVLVRLSGLALVNLAANLPALAPLIYLNLAAAIGGALWLLIRPRRARRGALPAAA